MLYIDFKMSILLMSIAVISVWVGAWGLSDIMVDYIEKKGWLDKKEIYLYILCIGIVLYFLYYYIQGF